jgi:hypothetical protein
VRKQPSSRPINVGGDDLAVILGRAVIFGPAGWCRFEHRGRASPCRDARPCRCCGNSKRKPNGCVSTGGRQSRRWSSDSG